MFQIETINLPFRILDFKSWISLDFKHQLCFKLKQQTSPPGDVRTSAVTPRNPLRLMEKGWKPPRLPLCFHIFCSLGLECPPLLIFLTVNHNSQVYFPGKILPLEIIIFLLLVFLLKICFHHSHPPLEYKLPEAGTHTSITNS